MKPLVSIIITTYKGLDTIERAVKSALSQTYDNIEVIVVDDNGKGTVEQLRTEALIKEKFHGKITYIPHNKNKNGSAARNTGIRAARGEYIALLDDDDAFRPTKIEKQVSAFNGRDERYAVCYTGLLVHFPDGRKKPQIPSEEGELFNTVIARKIQAPSSVLMFKREAALSIGGFDESFARHQDWEFLDRLSEKYSIAVVADICMDRYIYKRNSAKDPETFEKNRIYYLEKMKSYLLKLPDEERRAIYDLHYQDVCKEYLKAFRLKKAYQYLKLCDKPLSAIGGLTGQLIQRIIGPVALELDGKRG